MSVLFGRWNFNGKLMERNYLEKANRLIAPYGPDDVRCYSDSEISIHYHSLHTMEASSTTVQPYVTPSGSVITWDGRLDNRQDLVREEYGGLTARSSDVAIVAAVYEKGGIRGFANFVGDWTLAIWNPGMRSLILAKDPIGPRHLYYSIDKDQVTWSTILDPLVRFSEKPLTLNEEYLAGWLSLFPAVQLTPYREIHSVPPSSAVVIQPGKHSMSTYWTFDPGTRIRYRSDKEYEEHFSAVFTDAVRRRLCSTRPTLAELSGGIDSSSLVCVADSIIASGGARTPRLDTISFYDDSEPNWNERPYFTKVEETRGRTGCHVDVGSELFWRLDAESDQFAATPASVGSGGEGAKHLGACLLSQGHRVVLSGIGGDEILGGVPNPIPELQDLLAKAQLIALVQHVKAWALNKRKPWFHLLFQVVSGFFPRPLLGPGIGYATTWLQADFSRRHRVALNRYESRTKLIAPLPSFQENLSALHRLQSQLEGLVPPCDPPYEKWYPFLDRGLLEFIYAIPREQLVRPGQRRSLMRRALNGIVPDEILNRKRKAFATHGPARAVFQECTRLLGMSQPLASASLGIVDSRLFRQSVEELRHGKQVPVIAMLRTIGMEYWLEQLSDGKFAQIRVPNQDPKPRYLAHETLLDRGVM